MLAQKILLSGIGVLGLVSTIGIFKTDILKSIIGDEQTKRHKKIKHLLVKVKSSQNKNNIPDSGLTNEKKSNYLCKVG